MSKKGPKMKPADIVSEDWKFWKLRAILHEAEAEMLRDALWRIARECNAINKGPVAVMIAREALGETS